MKLFVFLVIFVSATQGGVVQQQRSPNLVRLAYTSQPQPQTAQSQTVQYTTVSAQSQNSAAHEAFAHQQHAQFVAAQQQQKLAKLAFGQSQPNTVLTQNPGSIRLAQASSSGHHVPAPAAHYKYIVPQQGPQAQQLQSQVVRTTHHQYVPLKVHHHHHHHPQQQQVAAPPQAVRFAPVAQQPQVQYVVSQQGQGPEHSSHSSRLVVPQATHQLVAAPQQPQQPQHHHQHQHQQQQQVRYVSQAPPARASPVPVQAPVPVQQAVQLQSYAPQQQVPQPQRYSHNIPSAAIRNVDTVAVQKTITPVITKTSQTHVHSEPAISMGNVQGFSQTSHGPGKVAEVIYNTRYTSYSHPTVGVPGPVTFAGPVETMGANAGANAIISYLSGHASGPSGASGIHTVSQPQIVAQQAAAGPQGGVPGVPSSHPHPYAQVIQQQQQQAQLQQQQQQAQLQQLQQLQQQQQQQEQPQPQREIPSNPYLQYAQSQAEQPSGPAPVQVQIQQQQQLGHAAPQHQFFQISQFQQPQPIPQPLPSSPEYAESPTAPTPSLYAVQAQQPQYSHPVQALSQPEALPSPGNQQYQFQEVHQSHPNLSHQQHPSGDLSHQIQQLQAAVTSEVGNSLQELTTDARGSYFHNL